MSEGGVEIPPPKVKIRSQEPRVRIRPSPREAPKENSNTRAFIKSEKTNNVFSVVLGLPYETYAKEINLFSPPQQPHVFIADSFKLVTDKASRQLVDAQGVRVLYMHGIRKDGQWYPEDPELQAKGITVQDLVESYEKNRAENIDALFVCDENPSQVKIIPFAGSESDPKIVMRGEEAKGSVRFDGQGKVNVVMEADQESDVEYQGWLNKRAVRTSRQQLEQIAGKRSST